MSTNPTLNPTKFAAERGVGGLPIIVSPGAAHAKEWTLGSEGQLPWHHALGGCLMALRISDSVSEQGLKTASM